MLRHNSKNFLFASQSPSLAPKGPTLQQQQSQQPIAKPSDQPTNGTAGTVAVSTSGNTPSSNPLRLFVNQLIFLDLSEPCKQRAKVKECLSYLPARVADCFSKDVKYVITNREKMIPLSDSTNPSSPSNGGNQHDLPQEPAKKLKTSPGALGFSSRTSFGLNRAQSVMEKASKQFKPVDVLTAAHRLGITVMSLNEIERYVDKYLQKKKSLEDPDSNKADTSNNSINIAIDQASSTKKRSQLLTKNDLDLSNHKIYKLKNPFLKFEPICKQYKPTYQEFKIWHDINFDPTSSKGTNSPFQAYFSDDLKQDDGENSSSPAPNGESQGESQSTNKHSLTRRPSQGLFKSPQSSNQTVMASQKTTTNNTTLQSTGSASNLFKTAQKTPATNAGPSGQYPNIVNSTNTANNRHLTSLPVKKKATGYCECCKQRFDNLKQHLTSAQHENFDKNQSNFKEIDEYVNGALNFKAFIDKKFPPSTRVSEPEAVAAKSEPVEETTSVRSEETKHPSSSLSILRGRGKPTPRPSLNTNEFPTMDTSYLNQEAILDAFNDFTYEIIEQNK